MFNRQNIHEYYVRNVLKEETPEEKTTSQILKDAAELHEYLRTYGSLKDQDKPLVVSGILLALDEISSGSFSIDALTGDDIDTDGDKIYEAIKKRMKRSNVGPDAKRDKLMSEFAIIRTSTRLNTIDEKLGKTPLKFYAEFLKGKVFDSIKYKPASEDFIGRFYGEFMSYSGGDGQSLGIVLTPAHICDLFCELLNVQPDDIVLDPCCGTAGFLVAAMHHMTSAADADAHHKGREPVLIAAVGIPDRKMFELVFHVLLPAAVRFFVSSFYAESVKKAMHSKNDPPKSRRIVFVSEVF